MGYLEISPGWKLAFLRLDQVSMGLNRITLSTTRNNCVDVDELAKLLNVTPEFVSSSEDTIFLKFHSQVQHFCVGQ